MPTVFRNLAQTQNAPLHPIREFIYKDESPLWGGEVHSSEALSSFWQTYLHEVVSTPKRNFRLAVYFIMKDAKNKIHYLSATGVQKYCNVDRKNIADFIKDDVEAGYLKLHPWTEDDQEWWESVIELPLLKNHPPKKISLGALVDTEEEEFKKLAPYSLDVPRNLEIFATYGLGIGADLYAYMLNHPGQSFTVKVLSDSTCHHRNRVTDKLKQMKEHGIAIKVGTKWSLTSGHAANVLRASQKASQEKGLPGLRKLLESFSGTVSAMDRADSKVMKSRAEREVLSHLGQEKKTHRFGIENELRRLANLMTLDTFKSILEEDQHTAELLDIYFAKSKKNVNHFTWWK